MTSILVPLVGEKYQFTDLKDATVNATVNAIAVVKYYRRPVKTRGTGYSLFVTLTDPSLNGSKLRCIFFNDAVDRFPQIQAVGDVIIMHRLIVREFRGEKQGCGYGSTGFAAAVFSGQTSDPLVPRPSNTSCQFGEAELRRVRELREWFNSPNCPVEREMTADSTNLSQPQQPNQPGTAGCSEPRVKRLWHLCPNEFTSIEGQVVAIYRYPKGDCCCLLYLWDGEPPESNTRPPSFMRPSKEHRIRLLPDAVHEPTLCTITAHEHACESVDDWSVPVFVYDEHANSPLMQNLKPGDVVRIHNVHVTKCRPLECEKPGCLRLVVHGGGHQFGRGLELLCQNFLDFRPSLSTEKRTDRSFSEADQYGLLTNLLNSMKARPVYLELKANNEFESLTISQLCSVPSTYTRLDAEELIMSPMLFEATSSSPSPSTLPVKWFPVTGDRGGKIVVMARLVARVSEIHPRTVDDLKTSTMLICTQCRSTVRVSSWLAGEVLCSCPTSDERFILAPFIFLKLSDCTGQLLVCASLTAAMALFTKATSATVSATLWKKLTDELLSSGSTYPVALRMLQQLSSLQDRSVDLVLKLSWLSTESDVGVPLEEREFRAELPSGPQFFFVWSSRS